MELSPFALADFSTYLEEAHSMFNFVFFSLISSAINLQAPHVIAEMTEGQIRAEVSYNDGRANQPHQAGSIGKYVCTLAALRMENEGLLSLDATITELLPGFEGPHADEVTLRRLLENRSGLADRLIPALQSDLSLSTKNLSALEAANTISVGEATKSPGVEFEYTNGNWVVIGAILEHASGQSLSETLRNWVLEPAGADAAYVIDGELSGDNPVTAKGDSIPLPSFIACIGGLAATPTDLLAISRYPFASTDFDFDDRLALQMITSEEQDYTLGGRFKLVSNADGEDVRRISWQSGNNGPWYAFVAYDPVTDAGIAMVTPDAENGEILLEKRASWVSENGMRPVE
ncbi:MAG: serine hydrolase domain-containing protein [Henriciella sp.]